ncbi:MAG: hypothetical protein AB7K86_19270 [Rhodospirillales bacterium]
METMHEGRRSLAKAFGLVVVAGALTLAAAAAPAAADGWRRDHRHGHYRGPVVVHPPAYYVPPPRVIYAPPPRYVYAPPPPVYYAPVPAPVYVAPPLFNFSFSGRF